MGKDVAVLTGVITDKEQILEKVLQKLKESMPVSVEIYGTNKQVIELSDFLFEHLSKEEYFIKVPQLCSQNHDKTIKQDYIIGVIRR